MRLSYTWPCPFCEYVGTSRRDFQKHKADVHDGKRTHKPFKFKSGGNCKFCGNYFEYEHTLRFHEKRCYENPERIEYKKHDQTEETRQKIKETNKIRHTLGGYRKGSGRGKKGWYKGYFCDSSWELAYVIYNIDHGIKFERNKEKFKYIFEGKEYNYLPDFIVDGKYVEVKGYWTKQWQAKYDQFPKELSIITKREIKPYLEYVENKYGKDFTKLYEEETSLGSNPSPASKIKHTRL